MFFDVAVKGRGGRRRRRRRRRRRMPVEVKKRKMFDKYIVW